MRYRLSPFITQNVLLKSNLGPHIHLHRDYRQQDSRDPSHAAPYTYRNRWNDVRPHQGRHAPYVPSDQPRKNDMPRPWRSPPPPATDSSGQYIEKCPIPGWTATPLPTACHSGAEEIDRNTRNAQIPARPEWYDNARRDTQRPSQVQPHTRQGRHLGRGHK